MKNSRNARDAHHRNRVATLDWAALAAELDAQGSAVIRGLVTSGECEDLIRAYGEAELFRSTVLMSRHGFGRGEYKYFSYPLPDIVAELRESCYAQLAPIANKWNELLRIEERYPATHAQFLACCSEAGQSRPTPLLLRYGAGDYNCLHQDLYGAAVFPLQLTILLSDPAKDFSGGEFVITEQRPRMQSRAQVVSLGLGDAVIFAVHHRPVQGSRGIYRVNLRHGVSHIASGNRYAAGIIFHDAK